MWNDSAHNKKFAVFALVATFISLALVFARTPTKIAHAEDAPGVTEEELDKNIGEILDDIDSNELDDFVDSDLGLNFFSVNSFKELVIKVLDGTYFDEYDSLFGAIKGYFKENLSSLLRIILLLLLLVMLYQTFNNFCSEKHDDFKKAIHIVFSLAITVIILSIFKGIVSDITLAINRIFKFSNAIFPILLNLILLSGATSSHSVYSSLSVFLLGTGSYIFVYVLLPISVSILLLSVVGSAFSGDRFSRVIDILKSIFKYSIAIFFGIFGVLSAVNLMMSGTRDGVSLKLTKFAIKNYIPILGGYISEGFDFVRTCSVLIKNAFGICGILVLLFMIIRPLVMYFVYLLLFKVLSAVVSFLGNSRFATMFDNASKGISYFVAVLVGVFLILFVFIYLLILSVSVV